VRDAAESDSRRRIVCAARVRAAYSGRPEEAPAVKRAFLRIPAWALFLGLVLVLLGTAPAVAEDEEVFVPKEGAPEGEPTDAAGKAELKQEADSFLSRVRKGQLEAAMEAGERVLHFSLHDVVKLAAEANLGLLAGSYEAPIAFQGMIAADANFDTLLTAAVDASRNETPVTNIFQGSGELLDRRVNASTGVTRNLRGGGTAALLYRADRLNTNNPFAALNPSWIQGVSAEVSQPLLRGAGDIALADIRRAQNSVAAARAGYDAQVQDTLLAVVTAYWDLVFSIENLAARMQAEEGARELPSDANARLAAEVGTPLDVAEARAGVERRVSEVLQSENLRATVQDQLLSLILPFAANTRTNVRILPKDRSLFDYAGLPVPSDEKRYVQLALTGRPELRRQKADIATRGVDVVVAHNSIRPQLDVRGSIGTQGLGVGYAGSFSDVVDGRAISGAIGLEFSLSLGQRAARASWMGAAWRRRQSVITYKEIENQVIVEVRLALRDIQTARGQVAAGRAEVKAAQENVDGERLRLEQGKSTPFNVLLKVNELTDAQTRLGRAAADVRQAESRLWRSVGTLVDRLGVDVNRWKPCADCR